MFGSRDCVDQGSNPGGFACWIWIFIIASGMSERSFCIFRRIHVRLTWASQVAYECFFFPPLVTKTDTWIRTLFGTLELGHTKYPGLQRLQCWPYADQKFYCHNREDLVFVRPPGVEGLCWVPRMYGILDWDSCLSLLSTLMGMMRLRT